MKERTNSCLPPLAVIDVGTNTIRLLIGWVKNGKLVRLASDRAVTRLGKDLLTTGALHKESIDKSIATLVNFKEKCDKHGVLYILAVGTSALRNANNSAEFISNIKDQTGIRIQIISGSREAELTFKGIVGYYNDKEPLLPPLFITDIGGGSTEWIFYANTGTHDKKLVMDSMQIGAVRLFESFFKNDSLTAEELGKANSYISEEVYRSLLKHNINPSIDTIKIEHLVATGGTATTLASIDLNLDKYDADKVHLHKIPRPALHMLFERLSALPLNQRDSIKGLEHGRADIIIPGTLILMVIMEILKVDEVVISDYGLMEGMLADSYNFQMV